MTTMDVKNSRKLEVFSNIDKSEHLFYNLWMTPKGDYKEKIGNVIVLPLWMSKTRERLRFCVIEINKGKKKTLCNLWMAPKGDQRDVEKLEVWFCNSFTTIDVIKWRNIENFSIFD